MKACLNIVKVGGKVVEDDASLNSLLSAFCAIEGNKMLVTGGGRTATKVAADLGIESHMLDGRRITDEPMLRVVTMVYAGLVSKNIVAELQAKGVNAIGLCGADLNIIRCVKRPAVKIDYGFVGDIESVNTKELQLLIDAGTVPVLCPITHDGMGQLLNTNADTIASAIASSLATKYDVTLTYCFEKAGVLRDPDDDSSVIPFIDKDIFQALVADGTVSGGMLPKLQNAFEALDHGVGKVVITHSSALSAGTTLTR